LTAPHFARTFTLASRHQFHGQISHHGIASAIPEAFRVATAPASRKLFSERQQRAELGSYQGIASAMPKTPQNQSRL